MVKRQTLKRSEDIHFAEVEGEFFLTLENRDVVVCMNRAAFTVVENLDGFTSSDAISDQLARHTKQKSAEMRSAVASLTRTLLRLGVLTEVEQGGTGKKQAISVARLGSEAMVPDIIQVWEGEALAGGLFVNSVAGDIRVIVPNVTDGPIKTCPPHTCTIPAGLFTADTIIRTFDNQWRANFEAYRRSGLVHFEKGG
jgi:hypothetical protein